MVLYLAGLKSVDPSLRDAAKVDGASEWQTFRSVIFPVMRPINVVVLVVTVIESLRAFDIVYVINGGKNGLELLSVLVYDNIVGEASRIGYGSAIGTILLLLALGFIVSYLVVNFRRGKPSRARSTNAPRRGIHVFLAVIAVVWLFPVVYAVYTSLRPYADTAEHGYVSIAHSLTFDNYRAAWSGADLPHYYLNSLIITVPAIVLTLLMASFVAFTRLALQLAAATWRC